MLGVPTLGEARRGFVAVTGDGVGEAGFCSNRLVPLVRMTQTCFTDQFMWSLFAWCIRRACMPRETSSWRFICMTLRYQADHRLSPTLINSDRKQPTMPQATSTLQCRNHSLICNKFRSEGDLDSPLAVERLSSHQIQSNNISIKTDHGGGGCSDKNNIPTSPQAAPSTESNLRP